MLAQVAASRGGKHQSTSEISVLSSLAANPDYKENQNRHPPKGQQHCQLPIMGMCLDVVRSPHSHQRAAEPPTQ